MFLSHFTKPFLQHFCDYGECAICFNDKLLHKFCKNHKFCNECCKDWLTSSEECPVCRERCNNKKFVPFIYTLKNFGEHTYTHEHFHNYFLFWHRRNCVKNQHEFHIRKINDKELVLHCIDCHIEELFPIELP